MSPWSVSQILCRWSKILWASWSDGVRRSMRLRGSPLPASTCVGTPVDWWEWSPKAFEEVRRRGVLVLLSVGYAACHWRHVVEAGHCVVHAPHLVGVPLTARYECAVRVCVSE